MTTTKQVHKALLTDENNPPDGDGQAHFGVAALDLSRRLDCSSSRGLSRDLSNLSGLSGSMTTDRRLLTTPAAQYDPQDKATFIRVSHAPQGLTNANLRLPVEVWLRILRYAAVVSQRSLVQAVATCSGLHGAAEEALYTFPTISNKWNARRFHSTIAKFPRRARMVRGLRLACIPQQADDCIAAVKETFTLLVRLETIELAFFGKEKCLSEPAAARLLQGATSDLRCLRRIRGLPIYASPRLVQCLGKSHLEEIHLYGYSPLLAGGEEDDEDDDDSDGDDDDEPPEPSEPTLDVLAKLRVLSCPGTVVIRMKFAGNITSLCITDAKRPIMDDVATLFGRQLVSLRLNRQLGNYSGMAYPTNWFKWERLPLLKFLDIQDRGYRGHEIEGQVIRAENLPASLVTLVWAPSWAMDCALVDSRSEQWRRNKIRDFADAVLRRARGVKTVVYRWANAQAYECMLAGEGFHYREVLAGSSIADDYAWTDKR
ncbi:hypothetical protein GY45DRAFT_1431830 [Cubamyces sp. BRFM 1775]|nr:hypothetical protein GY45DRAFT_1431830 [Cubamyces sp. BRFM 1775]